MRRDRPGYGLSDPLSLEKPELEDFAHSLAAFADSLGLQRFGLFGAHTGAMVAAEFARLYPERPTITLLDGYVVITDELRRDILANYFADYTPKADGSHLAHLWARIRDQYIYWPWYNKTEIGRRPMGVKFDVPQADVLQAELLDLLRTGKNEGSGYGAAFRADGARLLQQIRSPAYLLGYDADILVDNLAMLPPDLPDNIKIEKYRTVADSFARAKELLGEAAAGEPITLNQSRSPSGKVWIDYPFVANGQIFVRRNSDEKEKPLVLIHDLGASSMQWLPAMEALGSNRSVIAFDLPGHGETGVTAGDGPMTIVFMAEKISEALGGMGVESVNVVSFGGGGLVALELAASYPSIVLSLTAIDFWYFEESDREKLKDGLVPDLTPNRHGGHLLAAWNAARDGEVFWPWFEPVVANSIEEPPDLNLVAVQQNATDLLKAYPWHRDAVASAMSFDVDAKLRSLDQRVVLAARAGAGHLERCRRAQSLLDNAELVGVPIDLLQDGSAFLQLLES